jgi:sigma-B regulation protein RsbU (phosphoserine phosphatase)
MSGVTPVPPAGPADAAVGATILVVDDSPVNLRLVVRTLEGRGYRLLAAKNGRAALDIARRVHPDLILLDVMMPELDGFEVCRALKSDPSTRDAIVVFLSALGEVTDKVTGLELGASDYITKPIQPEEVIARVANHVARQQLEREVRRSRDRLERELASAGAMQRRILPAALPSGMGATFAAYYRTSLYAGGDYYDVFPLPDGQFGVIVADVSGHGAPSAIVMAMIRAAVHAFPGFACDPAEMLRYLNRHFEFLWESPMFATALSALIDPRDRSVTIACAGHPPPLLLRGRQVTVLPVDATMPVLMMDLPKVPDVRHALQGGDRLLFYTDGVTERSNPADDMFDLPRLVAALERTAERTPADQVLALVEELDTFAGEREPDDDQTLLLIAIEEQGTV